MKRPFFRVAAMVLSLVMLITSLCVSPMTASATETTAAVSEAPVLAYVPLDDRPVVTDRVQYAATAAGFDIQMPPDKSWYQTHLDNQLINEDNPETQYTDERQVGNGAAIMNWLNEMESDGCDYYIIHLDMMFSGGLVGSRYPDTSYMTTEQTKIADQLADLCSDTENHVYFVDTVMRLATTGGFKGYDSIEYNAVRDYCGQLRNVLDQSAFATTSYEESCRQIENIYNNYGTPQSGTTFLDDKGNYSSYYYWETKDYVTITGSQIQEIHDFRRRKLQLINYMIEYAGTSPYYVIGVDDASPKQTIQYNDINFIKQRMTAEGMGNRYSLFADTDSAALMALARCSVDRYSEKTPKVYVEYYGNRQDDPADQYDIGILSKNVTDHITCMGAQQVYSSSQADLQVLILTRIGAADPTDAVLDYEYRDSTDDQKIEFSTNITNLVKRAKANVDGGIPTIVMDCSSSYQRAFVEGNTNSKFLNLQDELLESGVDISRLLGYSNWNTAGNTLGIGLGQGMSRYAYLAGNQTKTAVSHIAATQSIAYSYIKDIVYLSRHKNSDYGWEYLGWLNWHYSNRDLSYSSYSGNFFNSMLNDTIAANSSVNTQSWNVNKGEAYYNNQLSASMNVGRKGYNDSSINTSDIYSDSWVDIATLMEQGSIYTNLYNGARQTRGVKSVVASNFRFPWYRSFEMTFNIVVELDDSSYVYGSDNYIDVSSGTDLADFVEDVKVDYTASGDGQLFGEASHTYDGYDSTKVLINDFCTLTSPGPVIYTADTIASVTVTRANTSTVYVGTGYQVGVTQSGTTTTYEAVVQGDIVGKSTDTEGDGMINTADAREVLRYVVGAAELTEAQKEAANMDDSGSIGSNDARRILQQALGM